MADELRKKYIDFFVARGHVVIPSAPLVPENDPTTLFTGSGMQPMIPYLLGQSHPLGVRLVDSQKCFRSQDIEEVGDNRHDTFFEMLGNWSLGDYFKEEQIAWLFDFLTQEIGLPKEKLWISVFAGDDVIPKDDEATAIWQKVGISKNRIFHYDETKNWWSRAGVKAKMPIGEPGGPDSEVFYEFTEVEHDKKFGNSCHPNCDCGRFMEIGNSVFMQYLKTDKGFEPLPQKNIDFGGGLERMLAAVHDEPDVFKIDLFVPIIDYIEKVAGQKYTSANSASFRVIADHLRAAVMLIADGVQPSNKDQGYFVRRLIRRAVRYGKQLGITQPFLGKIAEIVGKTYREAYPAVMRNVLSVTQAIEGEENKFLRTLEKGLQEFVKQTAGSAKLTAQLAFTLYETYGFPLELSIEEAQHKNLTVSGNIHQEFQKMKNQHADRSRTASVGKFKGGLADTSEAVVKYHTATHLLHAALRQVLGTHVEQQGSNITGERLRFDFTHPQVLTDREKQAVEKQINDWVAADLPVTQQTMRKDAALKAGALAFFAEKYPDQVSVYTIGYDPEKDWISKELCGGPHVTNTGEVGQIKITKEKAVAAGVRRLYLELV